MGQIRIVESTIIRPAAMTPRRRVWLSDLDLLAEENHTPAVFIYRQSSNSSISSISSSSTNAHSTNFFDVSRLKESLAKVLVSFYPVAGRLALDENNRIEIDCNGEGVRFVVAEISTSLQEFGDLAPSKKLFQLVQQVDRSSGISSFPILLVQVTRFKCGAVCLGTAIHHIVADGISAMHLYTSWSELCRGDDKISAEPFLDRTLLRARNPPTPSFPHIEYHPPPSSHNDEDECRPNYININNNGDDDGVRSHLFTVSPDQLARLKSQAPGYTTYEVLAGHVWRCTCKARRLPPELKSKVHISVNVRPRCRPPLPATYFGSPLAMATPMGAVGDLVENPLKYAVGLIHDALVRVRVEYVQSALDYLALHPRVEDLRRGAHLWKGANLKVTSWLTLGANGCDFGWGRPSFVGRAIVPSEGQVYVNLNAGSGEGGCTLSVALRPHHLANLKTIFYGYMSCKL